MAIIKNKGIRVIIVIMVTLSIIAIGISYFYYSNKNARVDPRVVDARKLYHDYDRLVEQDSLVRILELLEQIRQSYYKTEHYRGSFEMGVLYNNMAAVYISQAIRDSSVTVFDSTQAGQQKKYLLQKGDSLVRKSIAIYEQWEQQYWNKGEETIQKMIRADFLAGLQDYSEAEQEKYLDRRVKEILGAQSEINRRLSVAYTNLGIVNRHFEKYEEAAECYSKAINLWDRNLTAENNLRLLLGEPIKKRGVIEKLFPPEEDN